MNDSSGQGKQQGFEYLNYDVGQGAQRGVVDGGMGGNYLMPTKKQTKQGLARFNITDAAIQKMRDDFITLKIEGVEDSAGFARVHEARMVVKNHRVEVEKTRKALKEDALAYGRAIDAEAKRIVSLLKPIEDHLAEEEDMIKQIKAAEKQKAEEERRRAIEAEERALLEQIKQKREVEEARLAAIRQKNEEEERRLAAERAEIEAEKRRVEIARQELETAKRHAEEEERRKIELERQRKEAAERAKREAEEEAQRKAEAERLDKEAEIERERLRLEQAPDKEKLQRLISLHWPVYCNDLQSERANNIFDDFVADLDAALEPVRRFIDG